MFEDLPVKRQNNSHELQWHLILSEILITKYYYPKALAINWTCRMKSYVRRLHEANNAKAIQMRIDLVPTQKEHFTNQKGCGEWIWYYCVCIFMEERFTIIQEPDHKARDKKNFIKNSCVDIHHMTNLIKKFHHAV